MAGKKIGTTLLKIPIKKKFDADDRRFIAQEIIDIIVERTQKGKAPDNRKWSGSAGKYSDSYADTRQFKLRGKSKTKVNLKLSSDMLNSLELVDDGPGYLTIGYSDDNPQQGKAEGNILGTYGNATPIRGKKRDFLKISEKEKQAAMAPYDSSLVDIEKIQDRKKKLESLLRLTAIPENKEEDGEE